MSFELLPLPFAPGALSEFMSPETLDFHHGRHHRAYVEKVNAMVSERQVVGPSLVELVRTAYDRRDAALFNNAAQLWNHNFFWQCLAPPRGQRPGGWLLEMIHTSFGSEQNFLARLKDEATGHFSNGWAWLVLQGDELRIISLHDADTPLVHEGVQPLLTLDVWEHAYYIDYRNARGRFAEAVLENIINWEFVETNLDGNGDARADQEG